MVNCPYCGRAVADDVRFCPGCGRELPAPAVQEAVAQPPAPAQPYGYPPVAAASEEVPPQYAAAPVPQQFGMPQGGEAYLGGVPVAAEPPVKKKKRHPLRAVIAVAAAVVVVAAGALVGTKFFARDITRTLLGDKRYAIGIEERLLDSLAENGGETLSGLTALVNRGGKATSTFQMQGEMDDSLRDLIRSEYGEEVLEAVDPLLAYINGLSYSASAAYQGGKSTMELKAQKGDNPLLGVQLWQGDGRVIFCIPELSEKYVVLDGMPQGGTFELTAPDEKQLEASLKKVIAAYVEVLQEAEASTEKNQELEIGDVLVKADKTTLELDGKLTVRALKAAVKAVRDDEYLRTYITDVALSYIDWLNGQGTAGITLEEDFFRDACDELIDEIDRLTDVLRSVEISVYMDRGNRMVAREYVIKPEEKGAGSVALRLAMPSSGEQKGALAASLTADDEELIRASLIPTSKTAGEGLLRIEGDGQVFGFELAYENYAEKTYQGREVMTGTFTVSIYDPEDYLATASGIQDTPFPDLWDSTLVLTSDVEGDTRHEQLTLNLKGIGTITLTEDSSASEQAEVTLPEVGDDNAIIFDINGSVSQRQRASAALSEEYGLGLLKHLQKLMKEDAELAALLEKAGLTAEMLEEAIENGGVGTESTGSSGYDDPWDDPGWTSTEEPAMSLEQYASALQEQINQQQDELRENGMELEVLAEGSSLVYRYRYITDVGEFSDAKVAQEEFLDAVADTFIQSFTSIQIVVPEAESLVVEYWTMDGQLLASREFKGEGI